MSLDYPGGPNLITWALKSRELSLAVKRRDVAERSKRVQMPLLAHSSPTPALLRRIQDIIRRISPKSVLERKEYRPLIN